MKRVSRIVKETLDSTFVRVSISSLAIAAVIAFASAAKAAPIFSRGIETFQLKDSKGRTPEFKLLGSTPAKQALAMAVIGALNAEPDVQPKLPMKKHIDVKLERLMLSPKDGEKDKKLVVSLRVSGHDLELPGDISREEFLSGKTLTAKFPSTVKDLALVSVESRGELKFRLDSKSGDIIIENASGKLQHESMFGGRGEESIRFSGRGVRMTSDPQG